MSGTERLGVALVGLGGAVATTAVAGMELLRRSLMDTQGLPLAGVKGAGLVDDDDLAHAVEARLPVR